MIAFARKNITFLILKHTPPPVWRSPGSFFLSLHFFSTSSERKLSISPTLIDVLVHKHQFPPAFVSRVVPELTRLRNPENGVSVLAFFKESGFSDAQLEKIVKYEYRIMSASLEDKIKPMFKVFHDVGISSGGICKIITLCPPILRSSVKNRIIPSVSMLKGLLGSDNQVAKVICTYPRILRENLENTVLPNVEFFKSCGVPMERIRIILTESANCFVRKPEVMRKNVEKARELGVDSNSGNFIYAVSSIAKMSDVSWELKLQAFRDLGFSGSDISTMFRKAPQVFYLSIEKINKTTKFLLGTGKFNMCSIVSHPKALAFSIENRYIPRLKALGILESKNLIQNWPTLSLVCNLSDDEFFLKFIGPYSDEVGHLCIRKSSAKRED